jgi:DNA repair exonuclease SbcCD ATPase subunit
LGKLLVAQIFRKYHMQWSIVFFVILLIATAVTIWAWRTARIGSNREKAIRRFLDCADSLENQLQNCKERAAKLKAWVAGLPGSEAAKISNRLELGDSIQNALKQVLSQRLWLKNSLATASNEEILHAAATLARSGETLAAQMQKLEMVRTELESATSVLEKASKNSLTNVGSPNTGQTMH